MIVSSIITSNMSSWFGEYSCSKCILFCISLYEVGLQYILHSIKKIQLYILIKDISISLLYKKMVGWFMVFNATFNNISAISWRSVLLVEETGVPRENHKPVASH